MALPRVPRPRVLLVAAAGLFTATTLILFSLLGWSLLIALLVILIVALIVVIVALVRQLRQARASEEIEKTITRQADRDIERSMPDRVAEAQSMKSGLLEALEALKRSAVVRRGGPATLAKLPWYMLMGPAESGKSTLVQRSGLHFPLTDERHAPRGAQGVGGTRRFVWWLSEEAVVLDMPGRQLATADFEDNDDWFAFLDTLKRQRRQKPINGVLVAVGVDQLGARNDLEVEELGRRLRARVQELVDRLGFVVPVYVLFTRVDRVSGFAEHFGDLDAHARRAPWGATLPVERARSGDAQVLLEEELDVLGAALSRRALARVAEISDGAQRARAFAFPLQLERLRPALGRFVKTLFESDPRQETPLFRGFYFVTTEQRGPVLDRVFHPAARELGVALEDASPPPLGDGPSFLEDLFPRVVFPDASLAAASTREEARRRRLRVALFAGLGVAFLAITITLAVLVWVNDRAVARTRAAARQVDEQVSPDRRLMTNLELLDELRGRAAFVDSLSRSKPWWRRVGAYSGDALREPVVALTVDRAMGTVVGRALQSLRGRLQREVDSGEGDFLRTYHDYRVWRLLTEVEHYRIDDAPLAAEVLADVLGEEVSGETRSARERMPAMLWRMTRFLAQHRDEMSKRRNLNYPGGDPVLEERAVQRIRATWSPAPFYARMIREALPDTRPATLATLAGEGGGLSGPEPVPGAFSREGWERAVRPRIEATRAHVESDWLLHTVFQDTLPRLADQMVQLYGEDYVARWSRFLAQVRADRGATPREAEGRLRVLVQDDSPLLKLLGGVARETRYGPGPLEPVSRQFATLQGFDAGVRERAAGLLGKINPFAKKAGGGAGGGEVNLGASARSNYQSLLRALHQKTVEWAQPEAQPDALDGVLKESAKLRAFADQLALDRGGAAAPVVARALKLPVQVVLGGEDLVGGIGGHMPEEVNRNWNLLVAQPFHKTLAGKYPLAASSAEATLEEFGEFFRPGGTFWSFYDSFLKRYVLEDGTPTSQEASHLVSPELRGLLQQARAIRDAFFAGGGPAPKLDFQVRADQPKRDNPAQIVRWVALDLGGQHFTYDMGVRQWQDLSWPGPEPGVGAAVRANAGSVAAESRTVEGPWGFFRLLDQGAYGTTAGGNAEYVFRLPCGGSAIHVPYELQHGTARQVFRRNFLRLALPERL